MLLLVLPESECRRPLRQLRLAEKTKARILEELCQKSEELKDIKMGEEDESYNDSKRLSPEGLTLNTTS
ncbi:hypothetical protein SLE2022_117320 [Rubroshorea leprosula]